MIGLLIVANGLAADVIAVDPAPTIEVPAFVTVTDDLGRPVVGATVMASWRPGLPASREQTLGVTDSLGRVRWTPDASGIVALSTSGGSFPVRVEGAAPVETITLLGLLALVATGSAIWGARP